MTKINAYSAILCMALWCVAPEVQGQIIFSDNFEYTSGAALTAAGGSWSAFASSGVNPVVVSAGGLVYAGYSHSGVGNAINIQNLGGEGVEHAAATSLSGSESIYAGFLLQVSSASSSAGGLVLNFSGNGGACLSTTGFAIRESSGSLRFGLVNSGSTSYASASFNYNEPYLIVIEYNPNSKSYLLYVNPSLAQSKPAALHSIAHSCSSHGSINSVRVHQTSTAAAQLDGLIVSKSWADIVGETSGSAGNLMVNENFEYPGDVSLSALGNWVTVSNTGSNPLKVVSGSLSYNTYGNSGVGNMIQISASAGDGAQSPFTTSIGSGAFYVGFLISVASASGNPSGASITLEGSGNAQFRNSGFTFRNSGEGYQLGIYNSNSGSGSYSGAFNFGQVYLVVIEFDNSGQGTGTGGIFRLYVDPSINGPKPAALTSINLGSGASNSDEIRGVKFHQKGNGSALIDGVRAGTSWSDVVALETPAYQPSALTLASTAHNSMSVGFTAATDLPTGYLVVRKSGSVAAAAPVDNTTYGVGDGLDDAVVVHSGPGVSFTDNTGLLAETSYYYSVFSMNSANNFVSYLTSSPLSANAFTLSREPAGGPAVFTASSPDNSQINLGFSAPSSITDADGYLLYRSSDIISSLSFISDGVLPASFSLPVGLTLAGNVSNSAQVSFDDTGLAANTGYNYAIVPYNYDGTNSQTYNYLTSAIFSAAGLTRPDAPVSHAATAVLPDSFTANWDAVTGAESYRLDVATSSAFGGAILDGYNDLTVSGTSKMVSGLSPDTDYFYRIRAVNAGGPSANSNTNGQRTVTIAPTATAATVIGSTGFTANWGAVTGASGYKIDLATDAGFANTVAGYVDLSINGVTTTFSGLSGGTTYYFRVRALNAGGASPNSNAIDVLTQPDPPIAAEATFVTTSSFIANWNPSTGADEYRLDVFIEAVGTFLQPYDNFQVDGTSQSIDGLSEGVTYLYRVRAVNNSGTSSDSELISVLTVPPIPDVQPATSISTSGFTANWSSVSGATEYLLYVTDAQSNFLAGYSGDEPLAITSEIISGLQPNTLYHYYVKATSSSGTSEASEVISVLTLPSAPASPVASAVSQTGFTASWNSVQGITEYALDVSADDFASTVEGYNRLQVTGTSQNVVGLTPGTAYSFRVRAVNATGPSADSDVVDVRLIPADPVASSPDLSSIGPQQFTAKWAAVYGVDNYLLDVSANATFSSFLEGYDPKTLPPDQFSEQVDMLSPGTTYYYRVRARNSSGESGYSNTIAQITIPAKPVLNDPAQITSSSFLATWEDVPGATAYELDAYTSTDNFATLIFVPGYESKHIAGGSEDFITGLTPSTTYRFRVRSKNAGGVSDNSSHRLVLTLQSDGTTVNPPSISAATPTQPNTVKATISGGLSPWTVRLYHKKITGDTFAEEPGVEITNNTVEFQVGDFLDELGMEYYFKVTDDASREVLSSPSKYTVSFEANTKTFLKGSFAGNRSSIKMISIPYVLNNNAVETLFGSLGVYNKRTWRLAHYANERNIEYQTPGFPSIERGVGFWFNARVVNVDLRTSAGNAGPNDQNNPFVLELDEGWNQIGNPFPFPIDWADVLDDNPAVTGVSNELLIYDGEIQNFKVAGDLNVYEGAFVFADNAANLNLRVTLRNTFTSGRKKDTRHSRDLSAPEWQVPLVIKQGLSTLDLAGFGMHPEAALSKDRFDAVRLPRLDEYLDVTFDHPEYKYSHFSKDVVPTSNEYVWTFVVESTDLQAGGLIQWDNTLFGDNAAQLFLLDLQTATLVNMRERSSFSYEASPKRSFRVYYTRENKSFSPGILLLGNPYPNPARERICVNLVLPDASQDYRTEVIVVDHTGRPVKHLVNSSLRGGAHQVFWDIDDHSGYPVPSGVYLLRTKVNGQFSGIPQRLVVTR